MGKLCPSLPCPCDDPRTWDQSLMWDNKLEDAGWDGLGFAALRADNSQPFPGWLVFLLESP